MDVEVEFSWDFSATPLHELQCLDSDSSAIRNALISILQQNSGVSISGLVNQLRTRGLMQQIEDFETHHKHTREPEQMSYTDCGLNASCVVVADCMAEKKSSPVGTVHNLDSCRENPLGHIPSISSLSSKRRRIEM